MIAETSPPTTLLATVGLNPLPVALAILTLEPQQVLLVHSTESDAEAERIIEVVGEIFRERNVAIQIHAVTCGDGHDVTTTVTEFARLTRECFPDRSYLLDYTGGTKEMTIGAVSAHLDHHKELDAMGGDYRSWVDDSTGTVTTGGSVGQVKPIDSRGLTLKRIARLHGYDIEVHRPHLYAPDGTDFVALANDIAAYLEPLDAQSNTTMKDQSPAAHAAAADIRSTALAYAATLGLTDPVESTWIEQRTIAGRTSDARGLLRELLVTADALSAITDARGSKEDGRLELLVGAVVTERDGKPGVTQLECDPDVLIRDGHNVLAIEVKSNAKEAVNRLGERLIAMRWAFGSAVAVAIAAPEGEVSRTTRTAPPVTWPDVTQVANALKNDMFTLQKIYTWRTDTDPRHLPLDVTRWLTPISPKNTGGPPRIVSVTGTPIIAVPVDGTPLAVQAALHYANSAGTALGIGASHNSALRAQKIHLPPLQQINQSSEAATIGALTNARRQISGVVVTPGPKGVSAGLLRLAKTQDLGIVHITIAGRIQSLNPPNEEVSKFEPPWSQRFADYYTDALVPCSKSVIPLDSMGRQVTVDEMLTAITTLLDGHRIGAFTPTTTPTLVARQFLRAPLIVTGTRGAVSVQYGSKTDTVNVRNVVKSVSTHVHALVGDAHKPLIVLRAGDTRTSATGMKHLITNERWLPPIEFDSQTGAIIATEEASEALRHHLFGV